MFFLSNLNVTQQDFVRMLTLFNIFTSTNEYKYCDQYYISLNLINYSSLTTK